MALALLQLRFLVGITSLILSLFQGYVIHCDRHGGRSPPKAHRPGIGKLFGLGNELYFSVKFFDAAAQIGDTVHRNELKLAQIKSNVGF